jgi:hypothetical protein
MTLKFLFPNCLAPSEKEFQIYCAIKLLKGKYINKAEAIKMCGLESESDFDKLFVSFEKSYKKLCGRVYTDIEYEEDPEERE